uniref:Ig-like domain-containing protein n=1 Tax=Paramormyrops kingsleyae TaxID=1676925 RepID=A0A3B3S0S4_9TELE
MSQLRWMMSLFSFSVSTGVHQSPPALVKKLGESVQLSCSHRITNYDRMYWYQQLESGSPLKYLGNLNLNQPNPETGIDSRFSKYVMTRPEVTESSLEIKSLEASDSATYYCASSIAQ